MYGRKIWSGDFAAQCNKSFLEFKNIPSLQPVFVLILLIDTMVVYPHAYKPLKEVITWSLILHSWGEEIFIAVRGK